MLRGMTLSDRLRELREQRHGSTTKRDQEEEVTEAPTLTAKQKRAAAKKSKLKPKKRR